MKTVELKVARIGNSRGVRLPADVLRRYAIGDSVVMEEQEEGVMLRPITCGEKKLSWEETARQMATAGEDWSEWDSTVSDGLSSAAWINDAVPHVAEKRTRHAVKSRKGRKA